MIGNWKVFLLMAFAFCKSNGMDASPDAFLKHNQQQFNKVTKDRKEAKYYDQKLKTMKTLALQKGLPISIILASCGISYCGLNYSSPQAYKLAAIGFAGGVLGCEFYILLNPKKST